MAVGTGHGVNVPYMSVTLELHDVAGQRGDLANRIGNTRNTLNAEGQRIVALHTAQRSFSVTIPHVHAGGNVSTNCTSSAVAGYCDHHQAALHSLDSPLTKSIVFLRAWGEKTLIRNTLAAIINNVSPMPQRSAEPLGITSDRRAFRKICEFSTCTGLQTSPERGRTLGGYKIK